MLLLELNQVEPHWLVLADSFSVVSEASLTRLSLGHGRCGGQLIRQSSLPSLLCTVRKFYSAACKGGDTGPLGSCGLRCQDGDAREWWTVKQNEFQCDWGLKMMGMQWWEWQDPYIHIHVYIHFAPVCIRTAPERPASRMPFLYTVAWQWSIQLGVCSPLWVTSVPPPWWS